MTPKKIEKIMVEAFSKLAKTQKKNLLYHVKNKTPILVASNSGPYAENGAG